MVFGSCDGQGLAFVLPVFCDGGTGFEAEAIVSGFKDVTVVSKAVEQDGGHLCITEDHSPFAEAQVGGDHDASALVELAQHMKQKGPA